MASEFLRCIICPKEPSFSDTSHLLTHASSKGHLSHLHKLQIRSHQEAEAGQRLVAYNAWFRQHDVAQLLSERMQQKEARQASRRAGNKQRAAAANRQPLSNLNSNVFSNPLGMARQFVTPAPVPSQATLRIRRRVMQEEMDDPDYHPELSVETLLSSSAFLATPCSYDSPEHFSSYPTLEEGLLSPTVPDVTKLKGTIWPGMTLFDAATEEMQKKRNQKKDGSVLKHMQAFSAMIEPLETTYSPGGTLRRERHLDDLEDEEDLLEGETPVKKSPTKRKRKPLKKTVANKTRARHRRARAKREQTSVTTSSISTSPEISSSSVSNHSCIHSRLPSLDSDTIAGQFHETAQCLDKKIVKKEFSVFTDENNADPMSHLSNTLPNPFLEASRMFGSSIVNMPTQSAPWFLPQPIQHQDHDLFDDYGNMRSNISEAFVLGCDKENINPLSLKRDCIPDHTINPMCTVDGTFDNIDTELKRLSEIYAYTRNPLLSPHSNHHEQYNMAQHLH